MRVVVVGATGNVGTSLLDALAGEAQVESVLGLARRLPQLELPNVEWARADISTDDLLPHFHGADCVVHLAWKIQPSHDPKELWLTNVHGSSRVFLATAEAHVPALVYASSSAPIRPGRRTGRSTSAGRPTAFPRASTRGTRPRSSGSSTTSSATGPRRAWCACGRG